ncbi:hypothetical protein NQ315_000878 [Exocentrus adspersus]|uniref:Uncharacterized protein n=1 Tax=Exocentrus adspersus TaxID=1586481 RepID=A0AAV8WEQ2_9CUCU|nr:hypothetical protein NQ315_000878 [Exocentrus adspersus]
MAEIETPKYEELCRLCATKTTMVLSINIFANEGTTRQISKKICTCLPVQVHESDELPKMICENCLYKLEMFCDFRERSVRTEKLLVELYKELKLSHAHCEQQEPEQQQLCMVPISHHDLVMVQQHQLLTEQGLQNVPDLDLTHLGQRDGMIVGQEIILTHHVDINSHSLDSIELNHHDLTHDLSNHSLQTQESVLVDSNAHSIQDTRFTDSLNLIQQHQLLSEQFRLHDDLPVDIGTDETTASNIQLANEVKNLHQGNESFSEDKGNGILNEGPELDNGPLSVDNQLNNIPLTNNYASEQSNGEIFNQEDSSSGHSLLIDEQLQDMNITNSLTEKHVYDINVENGDTLVHLNNDSSKAWFYCNICGKFYEHKADFEIHYENHFFKCSVCLSVFANMDVLKSHRKEAHGTCADDPKPDKTRLKKATVPDKVENSVKSDNNSDSSEGDSNQMGEEVEAPSEDVKSNSDNNKKNMCPSKVCDECGKTYRTNYKLSEHMRKHTGEKPYKCKSCDKAFRSKIGLAQHEAKHTGQYDFSCPTCGKGFQCKSYLMVHQRVHSDVKPYPCTTCGQNFKTKQSLLDHTNRHLGVKPYMCDICGRGFITKGLCRSHQKIHSGLDNRKYSCKICSKRFVSKSYLQTHLRIHTGEKPFMCEVCGKGFLTRVDLKIHSTMHTGEKSYVCEMCGKAFARRDALRCHRRSHTGERPYSCDVCGQTFTQFTPMAIHKRLHTGERPYSCETCGKTFVSRSTMQAHAKKHVRSSLCKDQ